MSVKRKYISDRILRTEKNEFYFPKKILFNKSMNGLVYC